jgi:hypothetical protein
LANANEEEEEENLKFRTGEMNMYVQYANAKSNLLPNYYYLFFNARKTEGNALILKQPQGEMDEGKFFTKMHKILKENWANWTREGSFGET